MEKKEALVAIIIRENEQEKTFRKKNVKSFPLLELLMIYGRLNLFFSFLFTLIRN